MAENDNSNQFDDEYHFGDFDEGGISFDEPASGDSKQTYIATEKKYNVNSIKRNGLIVIGVVILGLVLYKFLGSFFSSSTVKKTNDSSVVTAQPVKQPTPSVQPIVSKPVQKPIVTQPVISQPVVSQPSNLDTKISQRLSALELVSKNARSQLTNVDGNIESLKSNVSEIASQITRLNNMLSNISEQLSQQQQEIENLKPKPKPKKRRRYRSNKMRIKYNIQAIIPGRAWLIGSNGATITVSEGTKIAGYGTVKLIDPHQGKVILTSGKTIEFSANDS